MKQILFASPSATPQAS